MIVSSVRQHKLGYLKSWLVVYLPKQNQKNLWRQLSPELLVWLEHSLIVFLLPRVDTSLLHSLTLFYVSIYWRSYCLLYLRIGLSMIRMHSKKIASNISKQKILVHPEKWHLQIVTYKHLETCSLTYQPKWLSHVFSMLLWLERLKR